MRETFPVFVTAVVVLAGAAIAPALAASAATTSTPDAPAQQNRTIENCTTVAEPGVYRLGGDLNGSADACIVISSDDVVLDGGGHTVAGDGSGVGIDVRADEERAQDPSDDVTVRNVRVESWETGVSFVNARNATAENVTVEDASTGIQVGDAEARRPGYPASADGTTVRNATLSEVQRGVDAELSDRVRVVDTRVSTYDHAGVRLDVVSDASVRRNTIVADESPDAVVIAETNGEFGDGTHDNLVAENRIVGGAVRVSLDRRAVTGTRIVDNTLTDANVSVGGSRDPSDTVVAGNTLTDGVVAVGFASGVRVADNTLTNTGDAPGRPAGIRVDDAGRVTVSNNTVRDARVGISVTSLAAENALVGNRVTGGEVGVALGGAAVNTTVAGNVLADNRDGVRVDVADGYGSGTNLVRGNAIVNNTDGVDVVAAADPLVVRGNDLTGNENGVRVRAVRACLPGREGAELVSVHGNDLGSNAAFGVLNEDGDVLNATGNDWGASDGPSSPDGPDAPLADPVTGSLADGAGSAVSERPADAGESNVHFDPFVDADPVAVSDRNETAA